MPPKSCGALGQKLFGLLWIIAWPWVLYSRRNKPLHLGHPHYCLHEEQYEQALWLLFKHPGLETSFLQYYPNWPHPQQQQGLSSGLYLNRGNLFPHLIQVFREGPMSCQKVTQKEINSLWSRPSQEVSMRCEVFINKILPVNYLAWW